MGDQAQRRAAKGIDDLGKMQQNIIRSCSSDILLILLTTKGENGVDEDLQLCYHCIKAINYTLHYLRLSH